MSCMLGRLCTSMKIMRKIRKTSCNVFNDSWTGCLLNMGNLFFLRGSDIGWSPFRCDVRWFTEQFWPLACSSICVTIYTLSSSINSLASMHIIRLSLSIVNWLAIVSVTIAINWTWLLNLAWLPHSFLWCVVTTCGDLNEDSNSRNEWAIPGSATTCCCSSSIWVYVSPIIPPSCLTWDLFCSCAWSIATAEKGLVVFWNGHFRTVVISNDDIHQVWLCTHIHWWPPSVVDVVQASSCEFCECINVQGKLPWWIYLMHTSTSDGNFTAKNQNGN